jgi:hypothetical protein
MPTIAFTVLVENGLEKWDKNGFPLKKEAS